MPKTCQVAPFVKKTYEMISENDFHEIISWSDEGNSFVVWKPQKFRKKVIPLFFKHNNLCSFIRQLNTYGFHKVNRTKKEEASQSSAENSHEVLEFQHANFIKDRKDLLAEISRKKSKNRNESPQNYKTSSESFIYDNISLKSSPVRSPSEPLCQNDVDSKSNQCHKTIFDKPNFAFATISSHSSFSSSSPSPPSTPTPEITPINIRGYNHILSYPHPDNYYNNKFVVDPSYYISDDEKYKMAEERNKLSKTITYLSLQVQHLSEELKLSQDKIKELENEVMANQFSIPDHNNFKRRRISSYPEQISFYPDFHSSYLPVQIQDQFAGLS